MRAFTIERRVSLKASLLERAGRDERISGVAVTGSAAAGREDRWSDIDLAFGVAEAGRMADVVADFTEFLRGEAALHYYDLAMGPWLYRVFFLPGGLQVDLAFVPREEFRALGPTFQLVSGEARPPMTLPARTAADVIGLAWLHALHARSCLLRGKLWQAEYMVSAVRDFVLELACLRLGLASAYGRGMDALPAAVTAPLSEALVGRLEADEMWRALAVALEGLAEELGLVDPELGSRVAGEIRGLAERPGLG